MNCVIESLGIESNLKPATEYLVSCLHGCFNVKRKHVRPSWSYLQSQSKAGLGKMCPTTFPSAHIWCLSLWLTVQQAENEGYETKARDILHIITFFILILNDFFQDELFSSWCNCGSKITERCSSLKKYGEASYDTILNLVFNALNWSSFLMITCKSWGPDSGKCS